MESHIVDRKMKLEFITGLLTKIKDNHKEKTGEHEECTII